MKLGEHQKCVDACTAALDFGSSSKARPKCGRVAVGMTMAASLMTIAARTMETVMAMRKTMMVAMGMMEC